MSGRIGFKLKRHPTRLPSNALMCVTPHVIIRRATAKACGRRLDKRKKTIKNKFNSKK